MPPQSSDRGAARALMSRWMMPCGAAVSQGPAGSTGGEAGRRGGGCYLGVEVDEGGQAGPDHVAHGAPLRHLPARVLERLIQVAACAQPRSIASDPERPHSRRGSALQPPPAAYSWARYTWSASSTAAYSATMFWWKSWQWMTTSRSTCRRCPPMVSPRTAALCVRACKVAGTRAWYQFSSDSRDLRYSLSTSGSADCRHTALYTRDALPWRARGSSALAVW